MKKACLAFGANVGDAKENIKEAYAALALIPGVRVLKTSSFYVTKPWGVTDQPDFVNSAALVETDYSPEALLGICLGIEAGMGRVRTVKNGPRRIDVDLLLYEGETRDTRELKLPHPRMHERPFVLQPLSELTDTGVVLGFDAAGALARLNNDGTQPGDVVEKV